MAVWVCFHHNIPSNIPSSLPFKSKITIKSDGNVLVVSLILGEAEIEGAKLDLGFCDIDGPLLLLVAFAT